MPQIVTFFERKGRWEQLESPPGDIQRIVSAEEDYVIVETSDNSLYKVYCQPEDADEICWEEIEGPIEVWDWPCESDLFPQPPNGVRDQVKYCIEYEYLVYSQYFLLEDGSLWRWQYAVNPFGQIIQFVRMVSVSTILGGIMGVILIVSKRHPM